MNPTNSMNPLVSIVVTTYGHEKYLDQCLSSLACQDTDFDYEIIVGNDCSPDNTSSILENHVRANPKKIRAFNHPSNLGMHENYAYCINSARGKYIALCEGDDFWNSIHKLARQAEILERDSSVELVCSDYSRLHETTGRVEESVYTWTKDWKLNVESMPRALVLRQVSIATPTVLFRKDSLERAMIRYPEFFSKEWPILDFQIFTELAILGKVAYIPEPLATYRVLPVSTSRRARLDHAFRDHLAVTQLYLNYATRLNLPPEDFELIKSVQFQGAINGALTLDHLEGRTMMKSFMDRFSFDPKIRRHQIVFLATKHSLTWHYYKIALGLRQKAGAIKHKLVTIVQSKPRQ